MKITQLKGPFSAFEQIKKIPKNVIHMGIELNKKNSFFINDTPVIKINNIKYCFNQNGILEWDNLLEEELQIIPLVDLDEYTVIDIAYE